MGGALRVVVTVCMKTNRKSQNLVAMSPRRVLFAYEGQLTSMMRRIKRFSLTACAMTTLSSPLLVLADSQVSSLGGAALSTGLVAFGFLTTGTLHAVSKPYLISAKVTAGTAEEGEQTDGAGETAASAGTLKLETETLTLLGKTRKVVMPLADAQWADPPTPLCTFIAQGRPYYMDETAQTEKDGLRLLMDGEAKKEM